MPGRYGAAIRTIRTSQGVEVHQCPYRRCSAFHLSGQSHGRPGNGALAVWQRWSFGWLNPSYAQLKGCAGSSIRRTKRELNCQNCQDSSLKSYCRLQKMSPNTNSAILAIPSGCDDPSGSLILGLCSLLLRLPDFTFGMVFVCHVHRMPQSSSQRPQNSELAHGGRSDPCLNRPAHGIPGPENRIQRS
jgi:hypothetical protein